jgi:uncharacterized protein
MTSAREWIERLGMTQSGVGGWFAAAMVSDETVSAAALPSRFQVDHHLYSSNWYLLREGEILQLHSLKQDELWFFHHGASVQLHIFDGSIYSTSTIGNHPGSFHSYAPHSTWFGGELIGSGFALVSCSLSPGYDPSDSSKPTPSDVDAMVAQFPSHASLIRRLAAT